MCEHVEISVLIPVHNTGKYLRRCLDSIIVQTFPDFEVVCVDDGSDDDSLEILEEYAHADSRFKVISLEENGGVAVARNAALDAAKGEYVYFIDSDDWIDPDYLEDMHAHAVSAGQDIVVNGHWYIEHENGEAREIATQKGFPESEPSYYLPVIVQSRFFPVVWCRFYKTKFLRSNGIRFPLIRGTEDNYFIFLSEALKDKVYVFFGSFYHYLKRKGSLSSTEGYDWYHIRCFKELQTQFKERGIPPETAKRFKLWQGMDLRLDTEEKFLELKELLVNAEDDFKAAKWIYSYYERAMVKTVVSCPDLRTFRRRYLFDVKIPSRINEIKNNLKKSLRKTFLCG